MEIIAGIVLVLSLFGNWHQASEIKEQRAEIARLEATNQKNVKAFEEAKANNDSLASVNTDLEKSSADCSAKLNIEAERESFYRYRESLNQATIDNLERQLAKLGTNPDRVITWDQCRLPDGLDIEAID